MTDNLARALTDALVRNAKPKDKPYKLTDGGGLFLLVQPGGAKLWRYKFRVNGREGLMAIGAYPDITLSAARQLHRDARTMVADGVSPVDARRDERMAAERERQRLRLGSFLNVMDEWQGISEVNLAPATIEQRRRECKNYLAREFGKKPVWQITRVEVSAFLKRVDAKVPAVARNLRTYLMQTFEYAMDVGLVDATPVPSTRMLQPRAKSSHQAMALSQWPDFLGRLMASNANPETKAAMLLVVLTVCRKQESAAARWEEFDLVAGTWTIPADRMKARKEHWVPLSRQALSLLRQLRQISTGEFLFPHRSGENRPIADRSLNAMIERLQPNGDTVHGFRSMFSTHFNGVNANADVIERCLAHAPGDATRAAYNRHEYKDERRVMLQEWADLLDSVVAKSQPLKIAA